MNDRAELVAKVILNAVYQNKEQRRKMKRVALDLAVMILEKLDAHDEMMRQISDDYAS